MFRTYLYKMFFYLATFFLGVAGSILASAGVAITINQLLLVILYMLIALMFGVSYILAKEYPNIRDD